MNTGTIIAQLDALAEAAQQEQFKALLLAGEDHAKAPYYMTQAKAFQAKWYAYHHAASIVRQASGGAA